jgi:O-antigen/teichoic acid export membrane protein
VTSFLSLGVGEICGRFVPEAELGADRTAVAVLASRLLAFKTVVSVTVLTLLFPILLWLYGGTFSPMYFVLIGLIALLTDWETLVYGLLFGLNKLARFSMRDPFRRILSLLFILFLFPRFGLLGALVSTLLVEVALLMLGLHWTKGYFAVEEVRLKFAFLKPCLTFGFALYVSWFLSNVWQRLGNVLINHITHDSRAVAFFDLANQGFLVVISMTVMIINSLVPMFSKLLLVGKEEKVLEWSGRLVRYVSILSVLAVAGVLFLGSDLIPFLIGEEYSEVVPNTVVLLLSLFPSVFVQIGFVYAVVYKRPEEFLWALMGALGTFVGLSVVLIPGHAAMGCSVATALSYYVMAGLAIYPFRDKVGVLLREGGVVIGLGALVLPLVLWKGEVLTNVLLATGFVGGFLTLLFWSRVVSMKEVGEAVAALRGNVTGA